jgi:hypothetical protein
MRRSVVLSTAIAGFLALSMSGCFKYTVISGKGGNMSGTPKSNWESHFLWGLIGEPRLDLKTICGSENATVQIERDFLQGLISSCLGNLWTPATVRVYCGETSAPAAALQLTPEQQRAFVESDAFMNAVAETAPEMIVDAQAAQAAVRGY